MDVTGTPTRFRFSLRTLVLLVILASAVILVALLSSRTERLENENQILRDQFGQIEVGDASKTHVLAVDKGTWPKRYMWRVFLPKDNGFEYALMASEGSIPAEGVPAVLAEPANFTPLDVAFGMIAVELTFPNTEADDQNPFLQADAPAKVRSFELRWGWEPQELSGQQGQLRGETSAIFPFNPFGGDAEVAGQDTVAIGEGEKPVVLFRLRKENDSGAAPGFIIWLQPIKKKQK